MRLVSYSRIEEGARKQTGQCACNEKSDEEGDLKDDQLRRLNSTETSIRRRQLLPWQECALLDQDGARLDGVWHLGSSRRLQWHIAPATQFNSLEITRVDSETSERFLGVRYVTVSAQPRDIRESADPPFWAKDLPVRDRARSAAARTRA